MQELFYEYHHDKDTRLWVNRASGYETPRHFHKSVEVIYMLKGALRVSFEDEEYTATEDDILYVSNYRIHKFSFEPGYEYEKIILILPCNYEEEKENETLPALLNDKEFNKKLKSLFELLYEERETLPSRVKRGYVTVLTGYLTSHYPTEPIKRDNSVELMVQILCYIDENYTEKLTLDSVSAHFGYNKYYFSRLFNKYIGEGLTNYIHIVRLQHFMRRRKKDKRASIADIAMDCGFESIPTFYRCFKKIYKKNPKEYFSER